MQFDDEMDEYVLNDGLHRLTVITDTTTQPAFNNTGTLDLEDLKKNGVKIIDFKDAVFSHYAWLDIEDIDTDSEQFWNLGIRTGGDQEARVDSFIHSFKKNGFDMRLSPPCIDTDENILEGRTRITAAQRNGEKYIPVAVYVREDLSERNTITNGLRANLKDFPQFEATFDHIVAGGVQVILAGELKATKAAIEDWLRKDVEAYKHFDNSVNGIVTKMRDAIIRRSAIDESLILEMCKESAHRWIKKNLNLEKSDYILVNAKDDETYADRAYRGVRNAVRQGAQPVNIIFYTTCRKPVEARTGLRKQLEFIERNYLDVYMMVNSDTGELMTLKPPPKTRPWKVLGVIPQIVQDLDFFAKSRLVPVEKYSNA